MRMQVWLILIVTFAVAGGMVAFQRAVPDESRRPSADALGFAQLSRARVEAAVRHATQHHLAAHRSQVDRRSAAVAARDWLRRLPGSGAARLRTVKPGAVDADARDRVSRFVEWADDLPPAAWSAGVTGASLDGSQVIVADGWVQLELAQADTRVRRTRLPVRVELVGATATPAGAAVPGQWLVVDVRVGGPRSHARAFTDPVVVDGRLVDVVAASAAREDASRWGRHADAVQSVLRERYRPHSRSGLVTIWVLTDAATAEPVLGAARPADRDDAPPVLHGAAWATPDGDIVLDAPTLRSLPVAQQLAVIRHELAHVATRDLAGATPALVAEGIAAFEERAWSSPRDPLAGDHFASLRDAFAEGRSGLAALLVARPDQAIDTRPGSVEYQAALATIAWLQSVHGRRVQEQLLARLDSGSEPQRALRAVLDLDARGVEVAVARWLHARDATPDQPLGDTGLPKTPTLQGAAP